MGYIRPKSLFSNTEVNFLKLNSFGMGQIRVTDLREAYFIKFKKNISQIYKFWIWTWDLENRCAIIFSIEPS